MDRFRDTISLKEATQYCDYSQEYLNLLIRKGKLKGVKMGRNWVTTRAWLNDYVVEHGHGSEDSEGRSSAENSKKPGSSFFQILNKPLSVSSKVIKKITAASAIACLAVMLLFGFIGAAGSFDYQKFSGNISADKIGAGILEKVSLVGGGIESVSEGIAFGGSNFKSACGKINISTLGLIDGASDAAVSFETKIEAGESALGRRGRFEALALGGGISRFGASLGGGARSMGEGRRAAVQEVLPEIAGNLSRSGNSVAGYFADMAYGRAKIGNEQLSFAVLGAATVFQNPKEFFSVGNLSRLSLGAKESILTGIGAFVDASSGGIKNGFAVQGRMMNRVSKAMNEGGQVAVFEVMPEMGRGSIGILADAGNLSFDAANLISVLGRDIGFNARDYAVDSAVTKKRFAEDRIAAYVLFNKKTTVAVGSAARSSLAALSGLAGALDERMEYGGRSVARGFSISADVANKAAGSGANYVQNNTTAGKASVFSFFKAIENKLRDIARSWLGITDPRLAEENGCNTANCAAPAGGTPQAVGAGISKSGNNQPADTGNIGSNSGNVTVVNNTYYQPVKEVLSTNTLVRVDQETKDRVDRILKQLDSDRPNFSLGQTFNLPANLRGNTININSGHFTVDKYGNIVTLGDVEITGNFTVTGAQTFSGAAALSASTATPLFAIDQAGAGSALRADNIALKGSTISTVGSDTSLLINPNGSGAVQFHTADNFIDSNGSLVLNGDITLTSGGTFYTTDNGNLVFAPNGTGNLVVGETGNTAKIVPFEGSTLGYDLGSATARWYDIYAKGKIDVDGTTLINNNLSFSSGTNLNSNQLSFINEGLITTGASKDITLQAGAGGKTIITSGTSTVEVADGAQALYAISGATAAKLADGTYALDATGDVRVAGNLRVSGGVLFASAAGERIDTTTDHLLKLTTSGDTKVVLGDALGANQFQIADSTGNIVATIDSDGNAIVAGNLSPSADLSKDLGDATHRWNNIYVANINTSGMSTSGQAVFTYRPLTTNFTDSGVLINPTTAIANAPLLGVGVGGVQRFLVDAEGDVTSEGVLTINGSGNNYFAGNVGIGTATPATYKLEVIGTGGFSTSVNSPIFQGQAAAATFGNAAYATTIAGSGLTVSPISWTATPTISGLITATSGLTANGALTANSTFTLGDAGDTGSISTSDWGITAAGAMTGISGIANDGAYTQTGVSANTFTGTTTFSNAAYSALFTGGNVGIGTLTPSSILSFGGDAARVVGMERNTAVGGSQLTVKAGGALLGGTNLAAGDLYLSTGVSTGTGVGNMYFQTATAGTTGTADNAPTTKLTILGSGNVGIGTTTPTAALDVRANSDEGVFYGISDHGWTQSILQRSANDQQVSYVLQPAGAASAGNPWWYMAIEPNTANLSFQSWNGSSVVSKLVVDTSGNVIVGGDLVPERDAGHDVGRPDTRWNNLYVANIYTTSLSTSGQSTFTFEAPLTPYTWASLLVNPTHAIADAPLFGAGVNGVQKFKIDAEGDVEIASSVSVPTITTAAGDLTLDPAGNTVIKGSTIDDTAAALNVTNATSTSLLYVRNGGNIGIGTTTPGARLDIRGGLNAGANGTEFTVTAAGVATGGTYNSQTISSAANFTGTGAFATGLSLTTGALNLTATSGALTLSGLSNSSISTGLNTLGFTSGGASGWTNTSGNLSLATATSGNIILNPFGTIELQKDTNIAGDLGVNGATSADITSTTNTATLFNSAVTSLSIGGAATTLNIGPTGNSAGNIVLAGGSLDTGCTLDQATGNFTCAGNIIGASAGTQGYWTRSGTTLSTATAGDAITTSGTVSTTGSGTITSAGLLTASNGLTLTAGALNLTATSGAVNLALSSSTTAFNINSGLFNVDTANNGVGIGTASLAGNKFKIAVDNSVSADNYSDLSKVASNTNATVSGGKLLVSEAVCGSYTVAGAGGINYGTVLGLDGRCWLNRNLGATQVATSSAGDATSWGYYYQWGRPTDGHQIENSSTTDTLSSSDIPGHANFIKSALTPFDWRDPQSLNALTLWAGASGGSNNVCPAGWHVPTQPEWATVAGYFSPQTSVGAFNSTLKLPLAGFRSRDTAGLSNRGSGGNYWSGSPSSTNASSLYFNSGGVYPAYALYRAYGFSVRCVKDLP